MCLVDFQWSREKYNGIEIRILTIYIIYMKFILTRLLLANIRVLYKHSLYTVSNRRDDRCCRILYLCIDYRSFLDYFVKHISTRVF